MITRLLVLSLFLLAIPLAANAAATVLPDESGFEKIRSSAVPLAIQKTEPSIFRILVPDRTATQTVDVRFGRGRHLRKQIAASKVADFFKIASLRQIDDCEQKQVLWGVFNKITKQSCTISFKYGVGTAFLAGSDRTLHTVGHVLENGVGFRSDGWRIYLFDSRGKLVFDSTDKILRERKLSTANSEFFTIELPETLGRPLSFSATPPAYGERVYVAGYPACTGCTTHPNDPGTELYIDWSDRKPHSNSDGLSLLVSKGLNLDVAYADHVSMFKGLILLDPMSYLFTNVDCVKGDSGGPAFNERGEIIGSVSTVSYEMVRGPTERLCTFARF